MQSPKVVQMKMPDGATSELTIYSRQQSTPDSPVVLLHCALGVPASYYQPLAEQFAQKGYDFAVAESRGVGKSSVRPNRRSDWGLYKMISQDLPVHFDTVKELYPTNPLFLLGHSLGGHLQALYLALQHRKGETKHTKDIKGLIFICSGSVHWRHFGPVLWVFALLISWVSWLFGFWPGKWFGFGGTSSKTLMQDWCYEVKTGGWVLADCPDAKLDATLAQIQIPSFWLTIEGDRYTVKNAALALKNKLSASKSTHEHHLPKDLELPWKGSGLTRIRSHPEGADVGNWEGGEVHFRWARKGQVVVERVNSWIKALV